MLAVIQHWFDPADPLNFARMTGYEPPEGNPPKHVFQPYGKGDTYSPPETTQRYVTAAGLSQVEADRSADPPDDIGGVEAQPSPVAGNVMVDASAVTLAFRQYGPPRGSDGHFVVFEVPTANSDVARFLGMAASGRVPQVGR